MRRFGAGHGTILSLQWMMPFSLDNLPSTVFADEPIQTIRLDYYFIVFTIGHEKWLTVECNGMAVVAPFLMPEDRSDFPRWPEDIDRV